MQQVVVTASGGDAITARVSPAVYNLPNTSACATAVSPCQIGVSFSPATAGLVAGTLIVTDAVNGLTSTVALSGTGSPVPAAPALLPSSVGFGGVQIGSTSPVQTVTVRAQGGDAVSARVTGVGFSLPSGASCAAGALSCQIAINFSPSDTDLISGTLIVTDLANGLASTVALSGAGLPLPAPPAIAVTSLSFGSVAIGSIGSSRTIVATPQGSDALIAQIAGPGPFQITQGAACAGGLPVCSIAVTFTPTGASASAQTLTVTDTTNGLSSQVALSGTGYNGAGAMAGLAYYLPFTDGQGATIKDLSGNSRDATIAGPAPVAQWTPSGLSLNAQTATIPAAAGLPTFGVCAYFPAATPSANDNYLYIGSLAAGGVNGANISGSYGVGTGHGRDAFFPQIGHSNGDPATMAIDGISGNHCVEAVVGSSANAAGSNASAVNDRIFIDGHEAAYLIQGVSDDTLDPAQAANAIHFYGDPGGGGFAAPVTIYSAWAGTGRDSSGQALARFAFERSRLEARDVMFGLAATSTTTPATASSCSITGTSIDLGYRASHAPSDLLNLDFPCTLHNFAVSGQGSKDMTAGFEDREGRVYQAAAPRNIAYTGGVTNGVINWKESPANALADLLDWNAKAHAQGWKTIVSTMISRCDALGYGGMTGDVLKQQVNALLLTAADQFDWVANQAAAPQIGADNACSNATFFADAAGGLGTHLSDAGQTFYVAAERAAFEGVYRSETTAISGAYTQLPSDALIVAGGSQPYVVTLMDANTGNFNRNGRVCVSNNGSATVTLQAVNGETVGGSGSLAVTPGAGVCFRPNVPDATAGGAVWDVVP